MLCEMCSSEHDGSFASGRFCSMKCSRAFATRAKRVEINQKVSKALSFPVLKFCKCCKKNFMRQPGYLRRRCPDCPDGDRSSIPFEQLRKDKSRKRRLIEERGHRCENCKGTEWMGEKIPIELDHIDGHPDHNTKDNLRLLCPNCHSQTPTHCGRNVGRHSGTERQKVMARYPSYRK